MAPPPPESHPPAPLLSVVTVVRDDRDGLRRTRMSLAAQTVRDFEWLVSDGGSTDGTADDVATALVDGTAAWTRSGPDGGPFGGMNRALAAARGRWLLFLNAGDRLAGPGVLAGLLPLLAAPDGPDLILGDSVEPGAGGRPRRKRGRPASAIAYGMPTHHCAILYRRTALAGLAYPERFAVAADYALTAALIRAGGRAARWPDCVAETEPAGISGRLAERGRMEQDAIRRDVLKLGPVARAIIGLAQVTAGKLRTTLPKTYDALRYRPARERTVVGGMGTPDSTMRYADGSHNRAP